MSGSRWDQPGVPHKGWHCVDVVDLRADLWGGGRVSLENVSEARSALRERFEGLPLAQRRELVRALLDVRTILPSAVTTSNDNTSSFIVP